VNFLLLERLFTERINEINTMKTHGDESKGGAQGGAYWGCELLSVGLFTNRINKINTITHAPIKTHSNESKREAQGGAYCGCELL
jgi:hypothetical protein